MERKTLGVRLDPTTWKNLEAEAARKGTTVSELAREKLTLSVEFDDHVKEFVSDFTSRRDISVADFLEGVIIDYMARHDAELEVYGHTILLDIPFFKTPEGDIAHGDDQYEDLKSTYVNIYTHEEKKRLLELEAAGGELSQRDRRFLIANKAGRSWLKSSEYVKEKKLFEKYTALGREAREKGHIPEDIDMPDFQIGKLYKRVADGFLSPEDFVNEISDPYFDYYYRRKATEKAEIDDGAPD